jgi:hypothetical protein
MPGTPRVEAKSTASIYFRICSNLTGDVSIEQFLIRFAAVATDLQSAARAALNKWRQVDEQALILGSQVETN